MLAALNLQDWIDFTPFFTSLDFKIRTNQGALRSMELEEVYKESPDSLYLAFFPSSLGYEYDCPFYFQKKYGRFPWANFKNE